MLKEDGSRLSPIWLIGDSNPEDCENDLAVPFDARHPARHSIWTPIWDVVQDCLFRQCRARADFSRIYIRNAIEDSRRKPKGSRTDWGIDLQADLQELGDAIEDARPLLVLTFGQFSFEFVRRALHIGQPRSIRKWTVKELREEFLQGVNSFTIHQVNVLPLLHTCISRGKFRESHAHFTALADGNYFQFVGEHLANILIQHQDTFNIWIR